MSRFDYVKYDEIAQAVSATAKAQIEQLEDFADKNLKSSREKALFMTNLEQAFMWFGKALKVEQEERNERA